MPASPSRPVSARARLSAEDRRRQLVGIGLRMLTERPIHELSIDEIAAQAGISRGLLFHYFATKRDFYVAVVRAAARRILRAARPDPEAPLAEQLTQSLDGYLGFLERRREPYVALLRGSAGGADYVVEIYEEIRGAFVERAAAALGPVSRTPRTELVLRGWFSFVEDTALAWARERPMPREDVVLLLAQALPALVTTAEPGIRTELPAELVTHLGLHGD
ncbi:MULTISPECIES: TetR/AcrR family transcriptional regulator [unclassified Streptomyces]|uniref:TetR/AcrR family transcriptional regulator n=1 Tax=unclassified Streptomyces TaxID=2593676 RepID=UPI0022B73FB9|nr:MULTISPECIES: TetR/AcrR family transcriptional regulator [unclassified Streptomyces]MCZ7414048.1 TetR/AcrR family transcriptional regulator [Streptomyces sp. WMMC897]MCZ7431044.1 TetR/AcrR family transcriptional regulator [Streptomyces sp. WMMC1477]